MNRSVINWMIAAGVLSAGAGVAPAAAVADPVGSGTLRGTDDAKLEVVRGAVQRPVRQKVRSGAENPDGGRDDDRLCCSRLCRLGQGTRHSGDSGIGLILAGLPVPQRPPVAAVERAVGPAFEVTPSVVAAASVPAVIAPAESTRSAPFVAAGSGPAAAAPVPVAPAKETRLAVPAAPAARAMPGLPAAPRGFPAPAELPRLGYPAELRNADFGKVASVALPGLAAIAGMTALGGLFGYRQAKAGYVLRAAGAGRFLQ